MIIFWLPSLRAFYHASPKAIRDLLTIVCAYKSICFLLNNRQLKKINRRKKIKAEEILLVTRLRGGWLTPAPQVHDLLASSFRKLAGSHLFPFTQGRDSSRTLYFPEEARFYRQIPPFPRRPSSVKFFLCSREGPVLQADPPYLTSSGEHHWRILFKREKNVHRIFSEGQEEHHCKILSKGQHRQLSEAYRGARKPSGFPFITQAAGNTKGILKFSSSVTVEEQKPHFPYSSPWSPMLLGEFSTFDICKASSIIFDTALRIFQEK